MEFEIKTIEDFIIYILKIQEEMKVYNSDQENQEHKGVAFRGQVSKYFELIPSIGRGRASCCHNSILDQERNLIEMAKYKLPNIFNANILPTDLLSLLQHYGIPTRLLDVTSNPLVALYFASLENKEDGEVFVFEYKDDIKTNYPIINAIAETYKFSSATSCKLSSFFEDVIEQPYFLEQKSDLKERDIKKGGGWIKDCCEKLMFIHAPERIERQKLQQGFYILFPNEIGKYGDDDFCFNKIINPIDKQNEQIKGRFIIKKESKVDILEKLDFLGVSEATLFADNIDIVCKSIVEQCKRIGK